MENGSGDVVSIFSYGRLEQKCLCNFGTGHYEEHKIEIIFEFRPVVWMSFKRFFLLSALVAICSVEWNNLYYFGRVHYGEH